MNAEDAAWRAEARRHVRAVQDPAVPRRHPGFLVASAVGTAVATAWVLVLAAWVVRAGLAAETAGGPAMTGLGALIAVLASAAGLLVWARGR